jgi:amino acid transporter
MAILNLVLGRRLASSEDKQERVGFLAGVSVFGLDGLGSAAYGPEAALTVLIPLGLSGLAYSLPILGAVAFLLAIVYFSYRQTIEAYPNGAGSYTVAKENLGEHAGLLAAVALMIDYTLNVAVGISSGVNALISAIPALQPYALPLCLLILAMLIFANLRGVRESGYAFMPPTYLFVFCLVLVLMIGIAKIILSAGHPQPITPPPSPSTSAEPVTVWLLLKAFAAGCTAMTGVEAVSNGIQAFKEPVIKSAQRALTLIVVILIFLLLGEAFVLPYYRIIATDPGKSGYQSLLSLVISAICGRGFLYYVTIAAILCVLCLSANTSFADFPRVCRVVARDGYLPYSFATRGRRLVFTQGIFVLAVLSGSLLIVFNGVTDKLIPLFAVGAFLAFTMSQAGMVKHWLKTNENQSRLSAVINGIGALGTGAALAVIVITKFSEGAWLVAIVLPLLFILMLAIKRHYTKIDREIERASSVSLHPPQPPIAVVVVESWNCVTQKALQTAYSLSKAVQVLHIEQEDNQGELRNEWQRSAKEWIQHARLPEPRLVILRSAYRRVITPILDYIWKLERENPDRFVGVVVPELIGTWYNSFLHNQRATILKTLLLLKGHHRILIISVPWYLEQQRKSKGVRKEPWNRFPAWMDR